MMTAYPTKLVNDGYGTYNSIFGEGDLSQEYAGALDQSPGSLFNNNWQVRFLDNTDCFVEGITPSTFNLPNPS